MGPVLSWRFPSAGRNGVLPVLEVLCSTLCNSDTMRDGEKPALLRLPEPGWAMHGNWWAGDSGGTTGGASACSAFWVLVVTAPGLDGFRRLCAGQFAGGSGKRWVPFPSALWLPSWPATVRKGRGQLVLVSAQQPGSSSARQASSTGCSLAAALVLAARFQTLLSFRRAGPACLPAF